MTQATCLLFVSCVTLVAGCRERAARPHGGDAEGGWTLGPDAAELPPATVVYQRPDGVYVRELGGPARLLVREAAYPRFAPDGQSIVFMRGNAVMRVALAGGEPEELARAVRGRAVCYHPDGRQALFTDGQSVRAVALDSRHVRTVLDDVACMELDISHDGERLVATVKQMGYHVRAFDLVGKRDWKLGAGCSASLSPDGWFVLSNLGGHRELALREWPSGRIVDRVVAPPGLELDNQYWSNVADWIVSVSEGDERDVYIHDVGRRRTYKVTDEGDCDRPDLFVGNL